MRQISTVLLLLLIFALTDNTGMKVNKGQQSVKAQVKSKSRQVNYKPGLIIPLYTVPNSYSGSCTDSDFVTIATSPIATRTIVIVNPKNGAGSTTIDGLDICITYLRSYGVKVIGYVRTKNGWSNQIVGYRRLEEVQADITQWSTLYTVDGILIDQVSSMWAEDSTYDSKSKALTFYTTLISYIEITFPSYLIVLNPGLPYYNEMTLNKGPMVKAIMYESLASKWQPYPLDCLDILTTTDYGSFSQGPWCSYVPQLDGIEQLKIKIDSEEIEKAQNAAIIYNVLTSYEASAIIAEGIAQNIGFFYLTDKDFDDAWSGLPETEIWEAIIQALDI